MKTPTLEKQLATAKKEQAQFEKLQEKAEKKAQAIEKKLEAQKAKNKPKSIMDRVKTFADVLKIAKPSKEALAIIKYNGKDEDLIFCRDFLIIRLIAKVLNEGHVFKMDGSENRYYPYFDLSSGFGFNDAYYNDTLAGASSASRLCFVSDEIARYAGTQFEPYFKKAITGK